MSAHTKPLLVLLPGLDGSAALLPPLQAATSLATRVVTYPAGAENRYRDLLPRVRDALPQNEDFVLLGWSFSGPLALMVAEERPHGLRGVILSASFVTKPICWIPRGAHRCVWPFLFHGFADLIRFQALCSGIRTPDLDRMMRAAQAAAPPATLARRVREVLTVDVTGALRDCPVPVMYLRSDGDRVVGRRNFRLIRQVRPDVEECVVPGPHLAMAIAAQQSAAAIEGFVAGLAGDPRENGSSGPALRR